MSLHLCPIEPPEGDGRDEDDLPCCLCAGTGISQRDLHFTIEGVDAAGNPVRVERAITLFKVNGQCSFAHEAYAALHSIVPPVANRCPFCDGTGVRPPADYEPEMSDFC